MSAAAQRQVAIVTGAAGGIGAETVRLLLDAGQAVAAVDVDGDGLAALARRLGAGARLLPLALDATSAADEVVAATTARLGAPSGLVNNAGVMFAGDALATSDEDWDGVVAHDLTGPFRMTRAVLPALIAAGGGAIVNVASIAGVIGFQQRIAYSAAKAGLIGLTRALSADHAHQGIRVNAVNPGTTESPMTRAIIANAEDPERQRQYMASRQPTGAMGRAVDVAAAIAFLLSDAAANITGSELTVDGGFSAV